MDAQIELRGKFPDFKSERKLAQLNDIVRLHTRLTPTVVMGATGCSFKQAMRILLLLFELELVDCYILIYIRDESETFIGRMSLDQGLPRFPYKYDFDTKVIATSNDVLYDFEFVKDGKIEVIFVNGSE